MFIDLFRRNITDFSGKTPVDSRMLPQLDDLVQTSAHIGERISRQSLERVRPCTPHTPIKRFWLVTENVTGLTRDVILLKFRGERTRNGCTSRISCPAWGLQSIQMMSLRAGTHGRWPFALLFVVTTVQRQQPDPPLPHLHAGPGQRELPVHPRSVPLSLQA